jgi:hypothetical protein
MIARLLACCLAVLAFSGSAQAVSVESRFYVQARNVTPGGEMRFRITNSEVVNLLVADIRMSGVATSVEDDEVAIEGGTTLVIRATNKPRLNVNLTIYAVCKNACPSVLTGHAVVPHASYGMLRTSKQDLTLTETGNWTLRLIN